jgi:predicted nucleic acid-binding protein
LKADRRFLIDTSAWIETLRTTGDPAVRARVSEVAVDDRAVLCDMVRIELWNGARGAADHRLLRELEEQLETVPTTAAVWTLARELARSARGKGLTVPAADLLIAACAEHHGLGLIHHDAHFEQLDEKLRALR